MDWDFIESVEFQGAPREEDLIKVEDGVLKLIKMMKNKVVEYSYYEINKAAQPNYRSGCAALFMELLYFHGIRSGYL